MKKLVLISLLWSQNIIAEELILELKVDGYIERSPTWVDAQTNTNVTEITFSFSSVQAETSNTDVDSNAFSVKLDSPSQAGQTFSVELEAPSGCSIGNHTIYDNDVKLVVNSMEHSNSNSIAITEGNRNDMQLRFSQQGSYGSLSGRVSCTSSGSLTYSY